MRVRPLADGPFRLIRGRSFLQVGRLVALNRPARRTVADLDGADFFDHSGLHPLATPPATLPAHRSALYPSRPRRHFQARLFHPPVLAAKPLLAAGCISVITVDTERHSRIKLMVLFSLAPCC